MNFTVGQAERWLKKSNEKFQINEAYLTALDQPIGDGDHGMHMAQGFKEVMKTVEHHQYETVGDLLQAAAFAMMKHIGGAAGPLFGTAFLKISQSFNRNKEIDYPQFVKGFEAALLALKERGRTKSGQKTLIDVWNPVVQEMLVVNDFNGKQIIATAKSAMEETKYKRAVKGRAAHFLDQSVGHIDPGATSSYYIFSALVEAVEEDEDAR